MSIALLVNPAARSGASLAAAGRAAERLRGKGVSTTLISGGSAAESAQLLRMSIDAGADGVLVAGGDGTVNVALQELAGTGIPFGIVPVGTGNDFAFALGLHEMGVDAAADAVAAGRTREVDLARLTRADGSTMLFGTVLASGFDARVNDRANRMRWPRGGSRYTIALLIEFLELHSLPFTLDIEREDGTTTRLEKDLVLAAIGNGPSYGGGLRMCPDADLADGLLDVTTVDATGRLPLLRVLPTIYTATHTALPIVSTYRARSVRIDAPEATGYADGDPVGVLPVRVDAVPAALRVFTP
ncbi:diacylglycerol kinase [Microbacterium horticulturae]|uniref:Diacylglycerol kinase n=1 Tax=Microbacterium horticulturae TaxID=3028316 RepID=A0ABY8BUI4_9MICO|nr:diacylglycerol kinase [Microbacterium sp. KACC 23027]WEG07838.1 diacylglycerol kinase [Microbacterium sp. KACC 23027]